MNTCDKYAALLDPYLDDECTPEESERVRKHLETCPACAAYVRDILRIREAFPTLTDTPVPDGFAENVLAALPDPADAVVDPTDAAAGSPSNTAYHRKRIWFRTLTSLAACFLLILLVRTVLPGATTASGGAADNAAMTSAAQQETGTGASCGGEEKAAESVEDAALTEYTNSAAKSYDGYGAAAPRDADTSSQRKEWKDTESAMDSASDADTGDSPPPIPDENDEMLPLLGTSNDSDTGGLTSPPVPEPFEAPATPEPSTPTSGSGASGGGSTPATAPLESAEEPAEPAPAATETAPETVDDTSDGSAEKGFVRLSLTTAEAGDLLADYTPVSADETASVYHLTRIQYDTLLTSLEKVPPSEPLDSDGTYAEIVVTH